MERTEEDCSTRGPWRFRPPIPDCSNLWDATHDSLATRIYEARQQLQHLRIAYIPSFNT